jgi:hypothetical protein
MPPPAGGECGSIVPWSQHSVVTLKELANAFADVNANPSATNKKIDKINLFI